MDSFWLWRICKLFIVCSLFIYCDGAIVQFFTEENFQGQMYQYTSSATCQSIPHGLTAYWSMKTTECIAVFYNNGCNPYNVEPSDFLLRKEEAGLGSLRRSYRDCNTLERGPEVNLDYFSESQRKGQRMEFRDICTCTNLPSFNFPLQSINSYGNSLIFYEEFNCVGKSEIKIGYTYATASSKRSVIPLNIPAHCFLKYKAEILRIEKDSNISISNKQLVTFAPKMTIVNNSSKPLEYNYEVANTTSDTVQISLPSGLLQMSSIIIGNNTMFRIEPSSTFPFIKNLENKIHKSLESTLRSHTFLNSSEPITINVENKREWKIHKTLLVPACTTYEVTGFGEMIETPELEYRLILSVKGQRGTNQAGVEDVQQNLQNFVHLNSTDEETVIVRTTARLKLNYGGNTEVFVTAINMPDCRSRFLTLKANVYKVESMTNMSDLDSFINQVPVTDKEIFINNGTVPQEDNFENTVQIEETGQFEFSEEVKRINYISIEENFESSVPFVTKAWTDLKNGLSNIYQNRQNLYESVTYISRSKKTYDFQKKINVAPCTKYEVYSFVNIAKDVEIEYRVQLRVTGKLGNESVGVDEIRDNLKGLAFLSNENNQTVLAESTMKLKAKFGVSSGVNAEGIHMIPCLEAHAAFVANCKFVCSG